MTLRSAALAAVLAVTAAACQKPEPPTITPKEARVTGVGPAGVTIALTVEARNPNGFTLSAQSITAQAKLDGKYDLGTVTVPEGISLPPSTPTELTASMTMPWADVSVLASMLGTPRPVPYAIQGTAKIGGEKLNVDVPFAVTGTITREQLVGAAAKGLPAIPGLTLPR